MRGKVVGAGQLWSGVPAKYERDLSENEKVVNAKELEKVAELAVLHALEKAKTPVEIEEDLYRYVESQNRPEALNYNELVT
jgi:ATP-dependent helicase/DNAse subunit B